MKMCSTIKMITYSVFWFKNFFKLIEAFRREYSPFLTLYFSLLSFPPQQSELSSTTGETLFTFLFNHINYLFLKNNNISFINLKCIFLLSLNSIKNLKKIPKQVEYIERLPNRRVHTRFMMVRQFIQNIC